MTETMLTEEQRQAMKDWADNLAKRARRDRYESQLEVQRAKFWYFIYGLIAHCIAVILFEMYLGLIIIPGVNG
jgi:hypothetical protein